MSKPRRPQAPKRRNFAAKHEKENPRSGAGAHRDRSKYDRYEDYLKDQLDDYVDDLDDPEEEERRKEEFLAKLKGEEYDPDMRKEWEDYLDRQHGTSLEDLGLPGVDYDYDDGYDEDYGGYPEYDDFDY